MAFSDNTRQLEMLFGACINTVVEDSLFISDMTAATNSDILSKFNITHIINASNGKVPNAFPDKYKYFNVNVEDNNEEDITPFFSQVFEFLTSTEDGDLKDKRVLIHCRVGVSRSATLLIALLMRQYAMTLREAFDLVKSRRPKIQPTDYFTDALIKYEQEIFPERESEISFKYMTGYSFRASSLHSKASTTSAKEGEGMSLPEGASEGEGGERKAKSKDEGEGEGCCDCCTIS